MKILYSCKNCGQPMEKKPENLTLDNPHPKNLCPCGTVLDDIDKMIVKPVSDEEFKSTPKTSLHPNYLE